MKMEISYRFWLRNLQRDVTPGSLPHKHEEEWGHGFNADAVSVYWVTWNQLFPAPDEHDALPDPAASLLEWTEAISKERMLSGR